MSAEGLKNYLELTGILSCNENPYLPCLTDIGCTWSDMKELVDRHELFYAKAYRKRVVYLSPEAYYLLKDCRATKPMDADAARLYALLDGAPPIEAGDLRAVSLMGQAALAKALDFLLEHLYITALGNGRYINPNWSTFRYGTAKAWEALTPPVSTIGDSRERLCAILERSMPKKEIELVLR